MTIHHLNQCEKFYYTPAQRSWWGVHWIHLVHPASVCRSVCPSVDNMVSERNSSLLWNFNFKFHMHVLCGYGHRPINFQQCHFENGCLVAILDFSASGLCSWHSCRSVTQVYFGISISNFICMLFVAMGQSLLIFRYVILKMATWQPYWICQFLNCNFSLAVNI